MSPLAAGITASLLAYLTGSLPFGLIVARMAKGIDIRSVGSGNIGATNVARTLGPRWGLLVLLLDAAKGAAPVLVLPRLFFGEADYAEYARHAAVACGVSTILGHIFPCWLRFRGGKGVATAMGVAAVLAPWGTLAAFAAFLAAFAAMRMVSLGSIVASIAFAATQMILLWPPFSHATWSVAAFSLAVPVLIIVRHRANVARILRGEEPRLSLGRKTDPTDRTTQG
jgi:acyl phosphate:glycerol-3-phosphate acyltransferase